MSQPSRLFAAVLGTDRFEWTPPEGKRAVITSIATTGTGTVQAHLLPVGSTTTGVASVVIPSFTKPIWSQVVVPIEGGERFAAICSTADTANIVAHGYIEDSNARRGSGVRVLGSLPLNTTVEKIADATRNAIVIQIQVANTHSSAITTTLHDVGWGLTATLSNRVLNASIANGTLLTLDARVALALGDSIHGSAATAALVNVRVVGFTP